MACRYLLIQENLYKMEKETLIQKLQETILERESLMKENESYLALNEANALYNKLVEDGITKKRGFTLRGIEDSHLFQIKLNS